MDGDIVLDVRRWWLTVPVHYQGAVSVLLQGDAVQQAVMYEPLTPQTVRRGVYAMLHELHQLSAAYLQMHPR
jgi:hypothetical protein